MNLSYWEIKSWLTNVDFTIIGSGIVGLNTALNLKEKFPESSILILEKGILPQGASTKNAGFACFGSLSELLDDLKNQSETAVFELAKKRINGLELLRELVGDKALGYDPNGGYELFLKKDPIYEECMENISRVNNLLQPLFNKNVFQVCENKFGFQNIEDQYVFNPFEGQLDTGRMMERLLQMVQNKGIKILNGIEVLSFSETNHGVQIKTKEFEFSTSKLFIANNGFATQLLELSVKPARAQVLITKPIEDLHIKGTFHLDQGYYYFRNIDNRILLGGGRNLDFKGEETVELNQTELIQNSLEALLKTVILPNKPIEIDHRWSGIMGVGETKAPIVKQLSNHVFAGVRLGGMGVAIGSLIGKELAELLD